MRSVVFVCYPTTLCARQNITMNITTVAIIKFVTSNYIARYRYIVNDFVAEIGGHTTCKEGGQQASTKRRTK